MPRQEAKESNCTGNIGFDTISLTMEGVENMGWGQNVKDKVKDRVWEKSPKQKGLWMKWNQIQLMGRNGWKTKPGTRSKHVGSTSRGEGKGFLQENDVACVRNAKGWTH